MENIELTEYQNIDISTNFTVTVTTTPDHTYIILDIEDRNCKNRKLYIFDKSDNGLTDFYGRRQYVGDFCVGFIYKGVEYNLFLLYDTAKIIIANEDSSYSDFGIETTIINC